jgi:hypothetical protein
VSAGVPASLAPRRQRIGSENRYGDEYRRLVTERPCTALSPRGSQPEQQAIHSCKDRSCKDRGHTRNERRHGNGAPDVRLPKTRTPWEFRRHGARVMTALVNSLRRIWSAKSRSPRLTGRGWSGSPDASRKPAIGFAAWVLDTYLELAELTQRTTPTVVVIALQILR